MSNLITSSQGVAHITPRMDAHWHRKIVSESSFIFSNSFEMSIVSNNEVSIGEGVGSLQGRFFDVETGTIDSVDIANGDSGKSRIDTICYKITNNILEGRQFGEWTVVQGEAVASNPTAPVITEGDLDAGDSEAYLPVANVNITDFQITSISMIAPTISTIKEITDDLEWTDITSDCSMSKAGGNSTETIVAVKHKKGFIHVEINLALTGSVSAGSNAWSGYLVLPEGLEVLRTVLANFTGAKMQMTVIYQNNENITFTTRQLSAGSSGENYTVCGIIPVIES